MRFQATWMRVLLEFGFPASRTKQNKTLLQVLHTIHREEHPFRGLSRWMDERGPEG
jgi:hypothetical protein